MTGDPLLSARDLRVQIPTPRGLVRAINGVDLDIARGDAVGIVGESGSGKTMLARTIMDILPRGAEIAAGSRLSYEGRDLLTIGQTESRRVYGREISMIFQDPLTAMNPVKKVGAHITESLRAHCGVGRRAAREQAVALLADVGIPEPRRRIDQFPHELSGGMRQRAMIAAAIACEPTLLIADEPTTALDVTVQAQILELLARLQEERQMALVLISHDLAVVAEACNRIAVMYAGQFVEVGPTQRFFERVRHPYSEALLESAPRSSRDPHTRLREIAGRPPDLTAVAPGCAFAPRCRYAQSQCAAELPSLAGDVELSRCFFPLDEVIAPATEAAYGRDR